ncbi:MAG TPA: hypothetical protein VMA83_12790 [Solirubrobacteraceae bacterium]|nr:hypothetical protein [Solirubrobacteraceae bacterium]
MLMSRFLDELTTRHARIVPRAGSGHERVTRAVREVPRPGGMSDPALDRASYSCGCGYVFDAAVSTSVACPHCGAGQAW